MDNKLPNFSWANEQVYIFNPLRVKGILHDFTMADTRQFFLLMKGMNLDHSELKRKSNLRIIGLLNLSFTIWDRNNVEVNMLPLWFDGAPVQFVLLFLAFPGPSIFVIMVMESCGILMDQ